jgi:hypothetical protein
LEIEVETGKEICPFREILVKYSVRSILTAIFKRVHEFLAVIVKATSLNLL